MVLCGIGGGDLITRGLGAQEDHVCRMYIDQPHPSTSRDGPCRITVAIVLLHTSERNGVHHERWDNTANVVSGSAAVFEAAVKLLLLL